MCTDRDVLLGKLKVADSWPANTLFERLLLQYSNQYPSFGDSVQKQQRKSLIVQRAIKDILANGGRFLRHCHSKTGPEALVEEAWLPVDLNDVEHAAIPLIPKPHQLSESQSQSRAARAGYVATASSTSYCHEPHAPAYAYNDYTAFPPDSARRYQQNHPHFAGWTLNHAHQAPTQYLPGASSTSRNLPATHRSKAPWRVPRTKSTSRKETQDDIASKMIDLNCNAIGKSAENSTNNAV